MSNPIQSLGRLVALVSGIAACIAPAAASAQVREPFFITLDANAAGPLNDPLYHMYGIGVAGGIGGYLSITPEFALGVRASASFLSDQDAMPQDPVDRGALDYGTIGLAIRLRPTARFESWIDRRGTGLYIDMVPEAALLDGHVVPAWSVGLGYNFEAGPYVAIGPTVRFRHLIETEGRFGDNHVATLMGGLEVVFLDGAPRMMPEPVAAAPRPAPPPEPTPEAQPEPQAEPQPFVNDALIVDERVFFDFDRSNLREAGKEQLDVVVNHFGQWGNRYQQLIVSGHADARGTDQYNFGLSRERADAVRAYLISHGVNPEVLQVEAMGEEEPEVPNAESEYEHQLNRRVQFRVVWREGQRPQGLEPVAEPTLPTYVDEAPLESRQRYERELERERRQLEAAQREEAQREEATQREQRQREIEAAQERRRRELREIQQRREGVPSEEPTAPRELEPQAPREPVMEDNPYE